MITGHSGAGKSEAIAAFEDGGYFCVDNLPPRMIEALGELFQHEGSGVERAAVVTDVRGGDYFEDLLAVLDELETSDALDLKVVFLEADEETLLHRYKETRRRHPLARSGRIVDGIREERDRLAPLRERADVVIDTTAHRRRAAAPDRDRADRSRHAREPARADHPHLRLQERAAARRRPHARRPLPAEPPLRRRPAAAHRAGRAVREYVESGTQAGEFYGRLMPLLDFLLPAYVAEGKQHLTIAVGCTGGRHRSVTVADRIARELGARDDVKLQVVHRDVELSRSPPRASAPSRLSIGDRGVHNIRCVSEVVISVEGLRKSYDDVEAVQGIDLAVGTGEIFAFLGPNGAGKTTTVEILEGYRTRNAGEVERAGDRSPAGRPRLAQPGRLRAPGVTAGARAHPAGDARAVRGLLHLLPGTSTRR